MKRNKKLIVRLIILVAILTCIVILRKIFVNNGEHLTNVIYASNNLIIQKAKNGQPGGSIVFYGSGYSLSLDDEHRIIQHDPCMIMPDMDLYDDNTTVYSIFFPSMEEAHLWQAGIELADFINENFDESDTLRADMHSKCCPFFANATQWIKRNQFNVLTVSGAFRGTPVTSKDFSKQLNWFKKIIFQIIFSNHQVDQDISTGSDFIKNADYSNLQRYHHLNIVATCPGSSRNPIDLFLMNLNENQQINGDGIIPVISQKINYPGTKQMEIEATHATSFPKGIEIANDYFSKES